VGLAAEGSGNSLPRVQLKANASPLAHFPYILTDSLLSSGTILGLSNVSKSAKYTNAEEKATANYKKVIKRDSHDDDNCN